MNVRAWDRVAGMVPLSLLDWPGRPCAVVFVHGCDLRCPHCHNADLAWGKPPDERPGRKILSQLATRAPLLAGVVLSGGEPLFGEDVSPILEDLFTLGLPVRLDTNGMHPRKAADLAQAFPDLSFAVDLKAPPSRYPEVSGGRMDEDTALANLNAIRDIAAAKPERFLFRTVALPQLSDADLAWAAAFAPPGSAHLVTPYRAQAAHRDHHAQTHH